MASIYKPRYLRPIPADAVKVIHKGEPAVRFVDGKGKVHVHPVHVTAKGKRTGKMVCEQRTWWMKYTLPDGTVLREKGFTDKTATEQEAARREREAQQAAAGLTTVDRRQLRHPLGAHLADYVADLERSGRAFKHYNLVKVRLERIFSECGWHTVRNIDPTGLYRFLKNLKRQGAAGKTQNDYLAAAKAFCTWCVLNRRLAGNPLESVERTADTEPKRQRRALTYDEVRRLLSASPPKRRLIYHVAVTCRLRRGELAALQWRDVHLRPEVIEERIELRAHTTKARRADIVSLPPDVAAGLRQAKPEDAKPTDKVFPRGIPKVATLKLDLAAAGIDFEDAAGRVVDLHAMGTTCGTLLAKQGLPPALVMRIMRHANIETTMKYYTDLTIHDRSRAVERTFEGLADPPAEEGKTEAV